MEKKYTARVNDLFDYEFTKEEIASLDARELSSSKYHVLEKNRSFVAKIKQADFYSRTYTVQLNSRNFQVEISDELDALIKEMGLSNGSSQHISAIKAPIPGLILEVNVKAGDKVKAGDYLMVLEAMKMENTLTAPRDAVVKKIAVEKGESVEKNQLLIEME